MENVLMFGWEYPPFKSGGLGQACRDLCKGLDRLGKNVTFVMPISPKQAGQTEHARVVGARRVITEESVDTESISSIEVERVETPLTPYTNPEQYSEEVQHLVSEEDSSQMVDGDDQTESVYGVDLMQEVERYAQVAAQIAREHEFDVIHAHDWMTYRAGMVAREISGKPLVAHIHATEFDRTADEPTHEIADRESEGLKAADIVIANSEWTKKNVMEAYHIREEKMRVVHWGIEHRPKPDKEPLHAALSEDDDLVLFLGRITVQKGPDYFIEAAAEVLQHKPDTKFVVAGEGDMLEATIEHAAELGIRDSVFFSGWLEGDEVDRAFQAADLFVMPSVSEPFGLVALEALQNETPVLLSKQSGVSEVLDHCLKVDFWDVKKMANKIVGALKYPAIRKNMVEHGTSEVKELDIVDPARKVISCYEEAISTHTNP